LRAIDSYQDFLRLLGHAPSDPVAAPALFRGLPARGAPLCRWRLVPGTKLTIRQFGAWHESAKGVCYLAKSLPSPIKYLKPYL